MAYSYVDVTGDGSSTDFTIPFQYIAKSHIHVYVNGIEITSFSWLSSSQIRCTVAPPNASTVRIKRITPRDQRLVDFQNGSTLDANADMDQDSNQLFFITQEQLDGSSTGSSSLAQDTFTGNGTNKLLALAQTPDPNGVMTITVNGVTMVQGVDYTISGQTITFTNAPPPGASIVVQYSTASGSGGTSGGSGTGGGTTSDIDMGAWTYDVFSGDGATSSYVLKAPPGNLAVLDVAVDGVTKTPGTDYLLSGQTLTFLSAPADGATILARYGAPLQATAVAMVTEFRTATDNQTVFPLTSTYQPGTNTMMVFVNGLILVPGVDYTETDESTVTIAINLDAGDSVLFVYGAPINANTVDGARIIDGTIVGSTKIAAGSVTLDRLASSLQTTLSATSTYTGEVRMFAFKTPPTGWLELNGGTIGDGASGGTARSNADTQALFTALWNDVANTELAIQDNTGAPSTRGASAAADFAAHKRFPLPDMRGEFARGWDNSRGADPGRAFMGFQADDFKSHVHGHGFLNSGSSGAGAGSSFGTSNNTLATGGTETRPRNRAFMFAIKL